MSSFLEQLYRRKDDRGLMANLRCYLVESKRHRAWPALNRLGIDIANETAGIIAALYATHPESSSKGNFGTVCRYIEHSRGGKGADDSKLTPTEQRFQHLLAAVPGQELYDRVANLVRMAKAQGIPINYQQLLLDLGRWNNRTKTEWAASFWAPYGEATPNGEAP